MLQLKVAYLIVNCILCVVQTFCAIEQFFLEKIKLCVDLHGKYIRNKINLAQQLLL
jgi:hypothetical protein